MLGSLYALHCPQNVSAYIGTGQVVNMFENEGIGFLNVMKAAKEAGNQKHIAYESGSKNSFMLKNILLSPHISPKDFISLFLISRSNRSLLYRIYKFDIYKYSPQYQMPVYYILGEHDTVTPVELSSEYFKTIEAPIKSLTLIPEAGHNPMYEQPEAFAEASSSRVTVHSPTTVTKQITNQKNTLQLQ